MDRSYKRTDVQTYKLSHALARLKATVNWLHTANPAGFARFAQCMSEEHHLYYPTFPRPNIRGTRRRWNFVGTCCAPCAFELWPTRGERHHGRPQADALGHERHQSAGDAGKLNKAYALDALTITANKKEIIYNCIKQYLADVYPMFSLQSDIFGFKPLGSRNLQVNFGVLAKSNSKIHSPFS